MNSRDRLAPVIQGIFRDEDEYMQSWQKDAERWEDAGVYTKVAEMAEPKDGRFTVDFGTGMGHQLVHLAGTKPDGLYIGTERTPLHVVRAQEYWKEKGCEAVSIMMTRSLTTTPDNKLYWKQKSMEAIREMREKILDVLKNHILIVDDDIRYPEVVPAILGDEKMDAAILGFPGGSAARACEWPFTIKRMTTQEEHTRQVESSNHIRAAFSHFASAATKDEGRALFVERVALTPNTIMDTAVQERISTILGTCAKYWKSVRYTFANVSMENNAIELGHGKSGEYDLKTLESMGHRFQVLIMRVLRNTVPFSEPPLPRPE